MADGAYFPRREVSAPTAQISVNPADSSFKAHKDDTVAEERPKGKPKGSRAKAKQKAEEMNRCVSVVHIYGGSCWPLTL